MSLGEFRIDDAVHSPEIYDVINSFDSDVPFWLEHAQRAAGNVLELCCGTGRITLPLVQYGIPIVGLDYSERMLSGLRGKAASQGLNVDARPGDMRSFDFPERFSLIFVPFNSFQCLYSTSDVEAALTSIRRHLEPDGRFILDVFLPSIELMVDRSREEKIWNDIIVPGRGRLQIRERCHYDAASQVNRVTWTLVFEDGSHEIQRLDMRCFYPKEIDILLKESGFIIEQRFGNYDRSPFVSSSPKQIVICRLAKKA